MTLITNNTQAYKVVQGEYTSILSQMNSRIRQYDSKCQSEWNQNTQINAERVLIQGASDNLDNAKMAVYVNAQMALVTPYRLWDTQVYNNIVGDDKHQVNCFDCFFFMHF
jgi:hypothetical protein